MTCLTEPKEGILEKHLRILATTKDERDANKPHQLCLFCVILEGKWQLLRWPFLTALLAITRASYLLRSPHGLRDDSFPFSLPELSAPQGRDHVAPALSAVRSWSQTHECAEGADGPLTGRVADWPRVPRRLAGPRDPLSS